MIAYYTYLPDLKADTLRKYSEMFQEKLKRIGVVAYNDFIFGETDEDIIRNLPKPKHRDFTLITGAGENINYGWSLKDFGDNEYEFIPLYKNFVGII